MALRVFRNAAGVLWQVWSVVPGSRLEDERRHGYDRRSPDPVLLYTGPERRVNSDRRRAERAIAPALAGGWLTFQSGGERRRLTPIPPGWDTCPERDLERLCARAVPVSSLPDSPPA